MAIDNALTNYADTLVPCVYDDFIGTDKKVLTNKHSAAEDSVSGNALNCEEVDNASEKLGQGTVQTVVTA